jgi:hypothetical protein
VKSSTNEHSQNVIDDRLTDELALRIMGWRRAPDRFIQAGRTWIPRWRFRPFSRLEDAFLLLDHSQSQYMIRRSANGLFFVHVRNARRLGKASGEEKARAICVALSQALDLDGFRAHVSPATSERQKGSA